jgi:hypothetical protein
MSSQVRILFSPRFLQGTSGSSSFGRASAFQAEGSEFEPRLPLHEIRQPEQWQPEITGYRENEGGDLQIICIFTPPNSGPLANVAQSVEHIHGKDEVTSSILVIGSRECEYLQQCSKT